MLLKLYMIGKKMLVKGWRELILQKKSSFKLDIPNIASFQQLHLSS
jgi:hypothetical protein